MPEKDLRNIFFSKSTPDRERQKNARRQKLLRFKWVDEERVNFLLKVSYDLTPLGFDYFVAYFLEKHCGYTMFVTDCFGDCGIDIKGMKKNDTGASEYTIVQCKQWNKYYMSEKEVAAFYGRVADIRHECGASIYFATTTYLTWPAKDFADAHNITYLDFSTFMEAKEYISQEEFKDYLTKHAQEARNLQNDQSQTQLRVDTNADLFRLLQSIRLEFARREGKSINFIAKDSQLADFIRHKPKNVIELLWVGGYSAFHTERYGPQFVEAISRFAEVKS